MSGFWEKIKLYFLLCRGYSLPISIMSCSIPFVYALLDNGNIFNGLIAAIGVIILHLFTNLFDDIVDYLREKSDINKGIKSDFNFQESKCALIRSNKVTIKTAILIDLLLFIAASIIGLYFILTLGFKIIYILIPSVFICILYPILGCLGLGEILVATIFSPFIYSGMYFAMTGNFSTDILILSISTGFLAVAVLHNHMLLDYKFDTTNRKITLSRLSGSEFNAFILLIFIILAAYLNLIVWCITGKLDYIYLLPLITFPVAFILLKVMKTHIENPDKIINYNMLLWAKKKIYSFPDTHKNFMAKFLLVENVLNSFSFVLCISIILDKLVLK